MEKVASPQSGQSLTLIGNVEEMFTTSTIAEIDIHERVNTNVNN